MAGLFIGLNACDTNSVQKPKPIDVANMDLSANPGTDFNQYANGGWIASHPVPEDKSRYGSFDELMDENEKQLRELVETIAKALQTEGSVAAKIADFYNTGMDTVAIEKDGLSALQPEMDRINSITTLDDVQNQIPYFHTRWISSLFDFSGSADAKNSDWVISYLEQGGLGLPDRDYYLDPSERFATIRAKYLIHIQHIFQLAGYDSVKAVQNASTIMRIETDLAKASMTRLDLRDPNKTYHKMSVAELSKLAPDFNWNSYFNAIGLENPGDIIVSQPDFFKEVNHQIQVNSVDDWKTYFTWNLLKSSAAYLNDDFVNERFSFYGKTMSGTPEIEPRWKRVLNTTNYVLSEAVGQIYVERYFPPQAKERMLKLVANLRLALGERIEKLSWMSDTTKQQALEKLAAINVKIGYPDKWRDYSKLEVKKDAFVLNVMRARQFGFNYMLSKINKPVDKLEWHMSPQTVNAYYNPLQNEIVFPAAILQPPFFFMDGDDAVNYGAIGVVIGHETTHGFDDKGRLFDKNGNLNTWWTDEDTRRFNERADVLVNQFDQFAVLDTVHANGKYTLGENIADLGGLNIAYTAFTKTEQWKNQNAKIDGFTPDQRFYLAYAHVWAQNIRDKEILRRTQEDVHSLGKFRVIGPLRNIPEFYNAFQIKDTDYMYLPDSARAVIW